jgi:peptidoglycan/xylan/chitin deacetylase (PgdA/CDA1 family)
VAITIDDGPDPAVTPAVLDILRQYQVKATFFCIGERAARYPELVRQAAQEGHAVENHGQRHRKQTSLFGLSGWRREVGEGQATLQASPAGRRSFSARLPVCAIRCWNRYCSVGVFLASWTRRGYDTRVRDPELVYARLTRQLAAGDILLLHDGNAARMADGTPVILQVLPRLLEELSRRQLQAVTLPQACSPDRLRPSAQAEPVFQSTLIHPPSMQALRLSAYTLTTALGRGVEPHLAALREQRGGIVKKRWETVEFDVCIGEVAGAG